MAERSLQQLLRRLRRVASPTGGLTDADLLCRFAEDRDQAAFESLVWRHGPLVYGVCRRVTGNTQDAEDAFQATFLILARKAGAVRRRAAVGPWLHRVAQRVALRARSQVRMVVPLPAELTGPIRQDAAESAELRRILTDEVMRLPARYRTAVVLRYLEGRTTAEAAAVIGCPPGTVLSRLAWARRRLRLRLTARGAALPAALAAAAVDEAAGAVPARWVTAVVGAAAAFATGNRAGRPAILAAEVLRAMLMTRLSVGAALVVGALAMGVGLLTPGTSPGRAEPPEKAAAPAVEVTVVRPTHRTTGDFQDYPGQTAASASVEVRSRITSQIDKVAFRAGAKVKHGDLLFELDSRPAQIEVARAQAEVGKAESHLGMVRADYDRAKRLMALAQASAEELDRLKAAVDGSQADLLVAKAGLDRAKLDLDATRIASPIDGQTGGTVLGMGNLATPTTTLVIVTSVDPLYVTFDVPERDLAHVQKLLQGSDGAVQMRIAGGDFSRTGKLEFVDNRVQVGTGTVGVRASLPNPGGSLLPGMSVTVRLATGEQHEEWLVPDTAVRLMRTGGYPFVLVAGPGNIVEWRRVTRTASRRSGQAVITSGIGPDDRVIVDSNLPRAGVPIRVQEVSGEK